MFGEASDEASSKSGEANVEGKRIMKTLVRKIVPTPSPFNMHLSLTILLLQASWLSNLPHSKKVKENASTSGQKPKTSYVISKPSPAHQAGYERTVPTVVVERAVSAPADVGSHAKTDTQAEKDALATLKREYSNSALSTLCTPNRRNVRLPRKFSRFHLGHRTAMATFAPGTAPLEIAQIVQGSLATVLAVGESVTGQEHQEVTNTSETLVDNTEPTSDPDDLTRTEFAIYAPQIPTLNTFVSRLSSAFEPPASVLGTPQIAQASLSPAPPLDKRILNQDYQDVLDTPTTLVDTSEPISDSDELTRAEFAMYAPLVSTLNSFATGLSSAFEAPPSVAVAHVIEEEIDPSFVNEATKTSPCTLIGSEIAKGVSLVTEEGTEIHDISSTRDAEVALLLLSAIPPELRHTSNEEQLQTDEEHTRRTSSLICVVGVVDEPVESADIQVDSATVVESEHPNWDEIREMADREYELRVQAAEASSVSAGASVSARSADYRVSVMEELSDVDWEEVCWDEEGREYHASNDQQGMKRGRQTPRTITRVVALFRVGKDMVRFLTGRAKPSSLASPK
ncbi:hypothetical protein FRB95_009873 [Tulasnella sp. JGI-2019a]|nr:hypothetical protein FRB95_009873 [Tulasnella sp. JGI-2019a]